MKKNDLSTARAALDAAEAELVAMRQRQDATRARLAELQAELAQREADRRQAVISGTDETAALADLARIRQRLEHGTGNLALLAEAEAERERAVFLAEGALHAAMTAERWRRFEAARAELWEALARLAPPLLTAGVAVGKPWTGNMARLFEEFDRDFSRIITNPAPPPELRAGGHLSPHITHERRTQEAGGDFFPI